uniref:Histidine--tRNA ligase n=1 Tax=Lygus hesperus TaxID=30085 RepID=A0A0A9YXB6_LYGHE
MSTGIGQQSKKRRKFERQVLSEESELESEDELNNTMTPTPTNQPAISSYDELYKSLMEGFRTLMNEKTETLATKEDLNKFQGTVSQVLEENKMINENVNHLREENKQLRNYVESLDARLRRNNVVLNGMVMDPTKNVKEEVMCLLRDVLRLEDLNYAGMNVRSVGTNRPIIIEFAHPKDVYKVLANSSRLKGTRFYLSKDLPPNQRARRNKMLRLRYEIRKACPSINPKIVQDRLEINNTLFDWETDSLKSGKKDGLAVLLTLTGIDFSAIVERIQNFKPTAKETPT